jgi:predicted outer membrane repeat protein
MRLPARSPWRMTTTLLASYVGALVWRESGRRSTGTRRKFVPAVSSLEARQLLAYFTVTSTLGNKSEGTLPWAITMSNQHPGQNIIRFGPSFFDGTDRVINLDQSLLLFDSQTTIIGPGSARLTISGQDRTPIFLLWGTAHADISGLTLAKGANGKGGAVQNKGTLDMSNCVFADNRALDGGGLWNDGKATVTNCTFDGNTAEYGGGIWNAGVYGVFSDTVGQLSMTDSTIENNSTSLSGNTEASGGGLGNKGNAYLHDCTFNNNHADKRGGGIFSDNYGKTTMINCTIAFNTALHGAGIANHDDLHITNCTIAGTRGAKAVGLSSYFGKYTIKNTLFAGNFTDSGADGQADQFYFQYAPPADSHIVYLSTAEMNKSMGSLANNGGPTETIALFEGNPAIGAGTSGGNVPQVDQRGVRRIGKIDVGAYQFSQE